jgi:hypothetical protein
MLHQSILLLVSAAIAVIINQATYNCTPPVVHHEQAGGNLGCRPAAGNGREGKGGKWKPLLVFVTDGICLYVKKKTFLGQNTKSYFYVKMTYVFMFLCFWECSNRPNKFLNKNFVRQGLPAKCKTRFG